MPGGPPSTMQRKEEDKVEILSGVFEGKTTGTPIGLIIHNTDARSQDYGRIAQQFRPGHADFTYWHKYGIRDHRGGGRSSARLTAPAVAAAGIAKKWLRLQYGTIVRAHLAQIGAIAVPFVDWNLVDVNPFFAANVDIVPELEAYLDGIRKERDSVGAMVRVVADNVPIGLGAPLYDRLDADIAYAMMGINAVKGVEIGAGFASVMQRGSEHGDEITQAGFQSNNAGGVLGGISSGQSIEVKIAIKPTSSIASPKHSLDTSGNEVDVVTTGRHDPCVGIRAAPIAEAFLALVLMDHALRHRAQCGDPKMGKEIFGST